MLSNSRLRLLSLAVLIFSLVLVSKLYMVQIVSGETFREKAEHQYIAGANYFDRGSIFFTTKDGVLVPAATVKVGFILAINPSILSKSADLNDIYDKINQILPLDQGEFMAKARKEGDPYEELSRRLPQEEADKIQALKIPGVSVYRERWRFYPGKELAAHAIGLMGYQGDDFGGRYGLERLYEPVLERKGDSTFVNFFAEIFSNIKRGVLDGESLEGDIITTIEPSVQSFLDGQLEKLVESYSPDFSGGIVIDPKTGEIFALSLFPQFDPNNSSKASDVGIFRNKFVEDRYEMGSIIKAIAMASALDSGAVTARTTYNDPGCMTLNNKTFCNYDGKSHGSGITMQTVLSKSLNTGMAFAAKQMGNQTFSDYMLRFGLGEKTGIDLPNEGNSLVSNLKTKRDLEMAQAAFGQGIALTPINTVRALSVLANGGKLIEPHLVKEISYEIGGSKVIEPKLGEQIISATTSEEISRMLTEVVDRSLRNGLVRLENYSVAAKTGTAQIARSGGYYDDRFLHSFFGYFPSYEPRFLVFLFTYYPKNVQYASETLTDTFINTTKFLINYYEIPPDREAPPPPRG